MIELLNQWDTELFKWVHLGLANPWFDAILPVMRNKLTWIPLYLFMLILAFRKQKRYAWTYVVLLLVTVLCADQFSAGMVKEWAQRLRPCNQPDLQAFIRYVGVQCGSGFSFISSHATNHMALAVVFAWQIGSGYGMRRTAKLFYAWAALIALAQVYVGVHYPGDVIVGMLAGYGIGVLLIYLYKRYVL